MKKADMLIIGSILLVALVLYALLAANRTDASALTVEIYIAGELTQIVKLGAEETVTIETEWGYNRLRLSAAGVQIVEADCASQSCVHAGLQSLAGATIACLPHRLLIRLTGQTEGGVDVIAY